MFERVIKIQSGLKAVAHQENLVDLEYILLLFFSTRIILALIGVLSRILLEPYHGKEYVWIYSDKLWLDIWGVWDTGWYLSIANDGYSAVPALGSQANYAFFPLYPMLMRFLGYITMDNYVAGIIISNICLLVSCVFLCKLVEMDSSSEVALRSVKYLFLFPTAYILSGVFTESLYLSLALACFYYARKGNWFLVGSLGFLLSLTRSLGVFIFLPMLYEYLKNNTNKTFDRNVFCLLLIPAGLLLFMIYNYWLTGDSLAFMHIQSAWDRSIINPIKMLSRGFANLSVTALFLVSVSLISLLFVIVSYNKLRVSYLIFYIYSLLIPMSSGFGSMPRFALVIFPVFIILSELTKERDIDDVLTIFLALLQGCLMVFWSNGFSLVI